MPLELAPLSELARKLERELERQDQLFRAVRESLSQLGDETRLSIPEAVLDELDAAFAVPPSAVTCAPFEHGRVRVRV